MVSESVALDVIVKESVDLVFDHLKCTKDGLSSDEVKEWLDLIVYSKLEEKKENNAGNAASALMAWLAPKAKDLLIKDYFRVKMITGDQLAIGKETGRRLGMGTNMYPSSALLGESKDDDHASISIDELIEKADEQRYEILKRLQVKKHICGISGDGLNDAPAFKKADIGIAVADSTDAARSASDIVLTEPGLSVIISALLTSRAIFQRMKNYTAI
ncbi:hypothetical protein M0R45_034946 [Rubus argutus]|uniref:Uncharacterized protein n=1 Tax=Rubus argutus TaxID=59490 RepID=A0AAW1VRM8_RUBAR